MTRVASLALALAAMLAVAGCASTPRSTFPPLGSTPRPAGDATAATSALVIAAVRAAGLPVEPSLRPYRPAEGPLLAAASRTVLQATLPDDPDHGFVLVYALASPADAQAAATDHAAYLASGAGRSQYPADARFTIRVVGATVIYFEWSPGAAADPRTELIPTALATLGVEVRVPG